MARKPGSCCNAGCEHARFKSLSTLPAVELACGSRSLIAIPASRSDRPCYAELEWLMPMALITAIELSWWAAEWKSGTAPAVDIFSYLAIAFGSLAAALALRLALRQKLVAAPLRSTLAGTFLVGVGASAFLPLKYAIPHELAFWLDAPLAKAERTWFGADPWLLLDHMLGWMTVPMDWLYGCWLPVQLLVLFSLILARPSPAKSRALVAYSLTWFLLGVVAATLLSSAGPLFYDRLYGGIRFAALGHMLHVRGASVALAESNRMWAALASRQPGLVAGISAMPSIHVAISLWIYLTARQLMPRAAPFAFAYFGLIWLGSVQLGWHYASDGLAGALGVSILWYVSKLFLRADPGFREPVPLRQTGHETVLADPSMP